MVGNDNDVVMRVRSLPSSIIERWGVDVHSKVSPEKSMHNVTGFCAWLFGATPGRVYRLYARVKTNGPQCFRGAPTQNHSKKASATKQEPQLSKQMITDEAIMCRLLRSALAIGVDGRCLDDYPMEVLRQTRDLRIDLGIRAVSDKYLQPYFARVVIEMAGELRDEIVARRMATPLPNLGIRSHFELSADGVDIRKTKATPYGRLKLLMVGCHHSDPATA